MIKNVALALYFVLFVVLLGPSLVVGLGSGLFQGATAAWEFLEDYGQTVGYPMVIPMSALLTLSWLPFVMSKLED
jgi:hypothetical protein